jgi:hypothetical protein
MNGAQQAALYAFAELVNRTEPDGQKILQAVQWPILCKTGVLCFCSIA